MGERRFTDVGLTPMNILIAAAQYPNTLACGARLHLFHMIQGFHRHGHSVEVLAFAEKDASGRLQTGFIEPYCRSVEIVHLRPVVQGRYLRPLRSLLSTQDSLSLPYRSIDFSRRLKQKIASTRPDVIYFDGYPMAQYGKIIHPIPQVICPRDCVSLLLERELKKKDRISARRPLLRWELRKRRHREAQYHRFHSCFFVARPDALRAKELSPSANIVWGPNGVDTDYFAPLGQELSPLTVAFTGSMGYGPNVEAVRWFSSCVWPLLVQRYPEAKFYVVGANPANEVKTLTMRDKRIVVTGFAEDLRPYLDRSAVIVVPMQSGTGIKNKVLEAMAMARPIVGTRMALEGIEHAQSMAHCLIAETPEEFAEKVMMLWNEPEKGRLMGKEARDMTLRHYSWRSTQDFCEHLLEEAAAYPGASHILGP
jgi:glycosyltransferase involved in cell wall biosynthesis